MAIIYFEIRFPDSTVKKIKRHSCCTLVQDNGRVAVKAVSEQCAWTISKNTRIDPEMYPIVDWQWKVKKIFESKRGMDSFLKKNN
jgi:hypothetical protein